MFIKTIYTSFIRPLIEYTDVVWDNCTRNGANELEKKSKWPQELFLGQQN